MSHSYVELSIKSLDLCLFTPSICRIRKINKGSIGGEREDLSDRVVEYGQCEGDRGEKGEGFKRGKAGRVVWRRKWEKPSLALRIFEKVMWKVLL